MQVGAGNTADTLADELRARSIDVAFACRRLDGDLVPHVEARGFTTFCLSDVDQRAKSDSLLPDWREDAELTKSGLTKMGDVDWAVVDHYGLDRGWDLY